MKIQFLGTAASPSTPLPFCQCEVCIEARNIGGKNLRRRSSILVNDDLLVDIGPDIMSSSYNFNISLSKVSICLQTHFHEDHFDPEMIISRHAEYGSINSRELSLVASRQTLEFMDSIIERRCDYGSIFNNEVAESFGIRLGILEPNKSYKIGEYFVTGIPANHGLKEHGCFNFIIEDESSCVYYFTDTSIIGEPIWDYLKDSNKKADLIILDCTYGIGYDSKQGDHLASKDFIKHVERFNSEGILKSSGEVYATHISHEGALEHEKFDVYAKEKGFSVAFDGMEIEL